MPDDCNFKSHKIITVLIFILLLYDLICVIEISKYKAMCKSLEPHPISLYFGREMDAKI